MATNSAKTFLGAPPGEANALPGEAESVCSVGLSIDVQG